MQSKVGIAVMIVGSLLVGLVVVVGFSKFRSAVINRPIDSYSITYEVTSDDGVESVAWMVAPEDDPTGASVERSVHSPVAIPFTTEVGVAPGQPARIQVFPMGEGAASCRIVKDAGRTNEAVLAEATSATPGASVTCEATMPTGKGVME